MISIGNGCFVHDGRRRNRSCWTVRDCLTGRAASRWTGFVTNFPTLVKRKFVLSCENGWH